MFLFRTVHPVKVYVCRISGHSVSCSSNASPVRKFGPPKVSHVTISNGIRVSAMNLDALLAVISVHFEAGSRFESQNQLGATHFVRNLCASTGSSSTAFCKTRHLQQLGAYLGCTADRQRITYTMICPRNLFLKAQGYLVDAATRCQYNPWDIDDRRSQIRDDLDRITPEQGLMDLIQTAAFRGPLANSIFCRQHVVDEMDPSDLSRFVKSYFLTKRCSVSSSGLSPDETLCFAEGLQIPGKTDLDESQQPPPSAFRSGYEFYDLGANSETWIALGVPGCAGSGDVRAVLTFCAVAAACGTRNMAYSTHRTCRIPQAPLGSLHDNVHVDFRAFSIAYSDVGLFGVVVRTPAKAAREAGARAAEFLRSGLAAMTPEKLIIGKRRLKGILVGGWKREKSLHASAGAIAARLVRSGQRVLVCAVMDVATCQESGLETAAAPGQTDVADLVAAIEELDVCYLMEIAKFISSCSGDFMAVAVVGDAAAAPTDIDLQRN